MVVHWRSIKGFKVVSLVFWKPDVFVYIWMAIFRLLYYSFPAHFSCRVFKEATM